MQKKLNNDSDRKVSETIRRVDNVEACEGEHERGTMRRRFKGSAKECLVVCLIVDALMAILEKKYFYAFVIFTAARNVR